MTKPYPLTFSVLVSVKELLVAARQNAYNDSFTTPYSEFVGSIEMIPQTLNRFGIN